MTFGTVVFLACLVAAPPFVHCLQKVCYEDYDEKLLGSDIYCYRMHAFNRFDMEKYGKFWNTTEGDQRYCEQATKHFGVISSSVSIRSKKEYEFVKVLYRSADFALTSVPMLIGLKYQNDRFHWFDQSPFNYSQFLEPDHKSRFYDLKKGQCRRFFMYSPPTYGRRKYYVFDIDCKVRFFEYRLLCRYRVPRSS
ncbi:unnamed protein product, partial [Litomosoides sigmodontis]